MDEESKRVMDTWALQTSDLESAAGCFAQLPVHHAEDRMRTRGSQSQCNDGPPRRRTLTMTATSRSPVETITRCGRGKSGCDSRSTPLHGFTHPQSPLVGLASLDQRTAVGGSLVLGLPGGSPPCVWNKRNQASLAPHAPPPPRAPYPPTITAQP